MLVLRRSVNRYCICLLVFYFCFFFERIVYIERGCFFIFGFIMRKYEEQIYSFKLENLSLIYSFKQNYSRFEDYFVREIEVCCCKLLKFGII